LRSHISWNQWPSKLIRSYEMCKLIQRGGLFLAIIMLALAVGIVSAHNDDGGYSALSHICYRKKEANEICYTVVISGIEIEICEKEESSKLKCIIIED